MSGAELSLEQAPPLSVPLRFFLTAPLFGLLAAALLGIAGPEAFASRWTPASLAATHLMTLGVLAMCMMGALTQMLPVVAGAVLPAPRRLAAFIHIPLTLGTLLLAGGLLFGSRPSLFAALPLLAGALLAFVLLACLALWRTPRGNATVAAIRHALLALAATALLGVLLGLGVGGLIPLPLPRITNLHAAWALLGWMGLLVAGVAYQVVPMFQLTPAYPPAMQGWLASSLLAALLVWSLAHWQGAEWLSAIAAFALASGLAAFAAATLVLQRRRRRRVPDATLRFWRLAMASLLGAVAVWALAQWQGTWSGTRAYPLILGVLWLVGFALSAVNGMLYKIVPFLVWLHLQSRHPPRGSVPNMKEIIGDRAARRQAWAHEAALLLLLLATLEPAWFIHAAAAAGGLSAALLGRNLFGAWRVSRRFVPEPANAA